jgi:hypothetical protein
MTVDNLIEEVVKKGLHNMKTFIEVGGGTSFRDEGTNLISFANHLSDLIDKGIVKGRAEI